MNHFAAALLVALTLTPEASRLAKESAALENEGNAKEALAKMEGAFAASPEEAYLAFHVGRLRAATGDQTGAADAYETYVRLAPTASNADDVRRAVARLRAPTAAGQAEARTRLIQGQGFFEQRRIEDAEAELKEAVALAPNWSAPYFNLGALYEATGRPIEALEYFKKGLPFAPANEASAMSSKLAALEVKAAEEAKRVGERQAKEQAEKKRREEFERKQREQVERQQRAAILARQKEVNEAALLVTEARRDQRSGRRTAGYVLTAIGVAAGAAAGYFATQGMAQNDRIRAGGFATRRSMEELEASGRAYNAVGYGNAAVSGITLAIGLPLLLGNLGDGDDGESVGALSTPSASVAKGAAF